VQTEGLARVARARRPDTHNPRRRTDLVQRNVRRRPTRRCRERWLALDVASDSALDPPALPFVRL